MKNRQPRGVPTGGRFAAQQHAEVDICLTEVQEPVDPGGMPPDWEAVCIARDWANETDKTMQFVTNQAVTPDGVRDWRALAASRPESRPNPDRMVAYLEAKAEIRGVALDNEQFLKAINAYDVTEDDLNAMWDDYRDQCNAQPMTPAEWAYQRGEKFDIANPPAPPVGTMIDTDQARALPGYTEVEAEFTHMEGRTFRLMARDMARYGSRNKHLSRRFTNLDTGTEVFIGGSDAPQGEPPFSSIRVTKHA